MIGTVIAALFPRPSRTDYVLGFGFVSLPGGLRDRRHGRRSSQPGPRDHA